MAVAGVGSKLSLLKNSEYSSIPEVRKASNRKSVVSCGIDGEIREPDVYSRK